MEMDEALDKLSTEELWVLFDLSVLVRQLVRSQIPLAEVLDRIKAEMERHPLDPGICALMIVYLAELSVKEAVNVSRGRAARGLGHS